MAQQIACLREALRLDKVGHRLPSHSPKESVEVEWRNKELPRKLLQTQGLGKILLHMAYGCIDALMAGRRHKFAQVQR